MNARIAAKYPKLSEAEIKVLVVDDKWFATISADVQGELDRVSQTLSGRVLQLSERYATRLAQLNDQNSALSLKVLAHLRKMGAVCE